MRLRSNGLRPRLPSINPERSRGAPQTTRVIDAFHLVRGELLGEALHRALVLGRDQHAARVLVEAVHDAGPRHAADPFERRPAMGQKRVHQRAVQIAGRGMHHEPRLLVDDDEIVVLVEDDERNVLRLRLGRYGRRHGDGIALARFDPEVRVSYRGFAFAHAAFFDQRLEPRARQIGQPLCQEMIQPPASMHVARVQLAQLSVHG